MIKQVFYYYYYLFYQKILDPDPRLAATLGLTALEGYFVNAILNILMARLFCFDWSLYYSLGVVAIVLGLNVFYFFSSRRVTKLLKAKPKFFGSHRWTVVVVWVFSLLVISTLFWIGDYVNGMLDRCR